MLGIRGRDEVVPDVDKKYSFLVYVDDLFECGFTIARGAKVLAEE